MEAVLESKHIAWVAVYADETVLTQFNEDGSENGYGAIDRSKLSEFHVIDRDTEESLFSMALEPEQRLVYRKRVSMDGQGTLIWQVYLVGWQRTVGGENIQSLNWILPTGQIINTGKFREDHPVFYGVQWMDFEEED